MSSHDISFNNPIIFYPAVAATAGALIYGISQAVKGCANGVQRCYRKYRPLPPPPVPVVALDHLIAAFSAIAGARGAATAATNPAAAGNPAVFAGIAAGAAAAYHARTHHINPTGIVAVAGAAAGIAAADIATNLPLASLASISGAAVEAARVAARAAGGTLTEQIVAGAAAGAFVTRRTQGSDIPTSAAAAGAAAGAAIAQRLIADGSNERDVINGARDAAVLAAIAASADAALLNEIGEAAASAAAAAFALASTPLPPLPVLPILPIALNNATASAAAEAARGIYSTLNLATQNPREIGLRAGSTAAEAARRANVNEAGIVAMAGVAAGKAAGEILLAASPNQRLAALDNAKRIASEAARAAGNAPYQRVAASTAVGILIGGFIGANFEDISAEERAITATRSAVLEVIQKAINNGLLLDEIVAVARETASIIAFAVGVPEANLPNLIEVAGIEARAADTARNIKGPLSPNHVSDILNIGATAGANAMTQAQANYVAANAGRADVSPFSATSDDHVRAAAAAGAAAAHHAFRTCGVDIVGTAAIAGRAAAIFAIDHGIDPQSAAQLAAIQAATTYGATHEEATIAGASAGAAAAAYSLHVGDDVAKALVAAMAAGAEAASAGGDSAGFTASATAIAAGAQYIEANRVGVEARVAARTAAANTAALAAGARAAAPPSVAPIANPSWMGRAIKYLNDGKKYLEQAGPGQVEKVKTFLNKILPTGVDKGIASGIGFVALGSALLVSSGVGIGVAITGAAIEGSKQYLDRSIAQAAAADQAAKATEALFTDLEKNRGLNQFRIGKETVMENSLYEPLKIAEWLYEIQPTKQGIINPGTGIVSSVLQLLADPYFMEELPKAIGRRLCESELFTGGVVEVFKSPVGKELTRDQQTALLGIGTLLRKPKPIDQNELDLLRQHLQAFGKGGLPSGLSEQNQRAINELLSLLELHACYTAPEIPESQVENLYEVLRRIPLSNIKKFPEKMSESDPYDVLRTLTVLMGENPKRSHIPAHAKKIKFRSKEDAPERLVYVASRGGPVNPSRSVEIPNTDGSSTTYRLSGMIHWALPEEGNPGNGEATATVVRNLGGRGLWGKRETWHDHDTTNALPSQNRVVDPNKLPERPYMWVLRKA